MTYKQKLKRNIKLYRWLNLFAGMIFTVPVWVSFYTRILNFTQLAFFCSLGLGVTVLLEMPSGALADLIGRRKTVMLGFLLFGLLDVLIIFASTSWLLLIVILVSGVAEALISGSDVALLFDTLKELKKENNFPKINARNSLIFRMALIAATFFGGYLYKAFIGLPYIVMGITRFVIVGIVLLMVEPKIDTEKFSISSYAKQVKDGFKELFKSSYMKKLTIYYAFVGGITWTCLSYFNPPFIQEFGFSEVERSWVFGLIYLFASLILLLLTKKDEFLTRNRIYLGFPLVLVLSLLPGIFSTKALAPLLVLGTTFAGISRFVILDKYTNKEFLSKYRATAISALNMLVSLFYMIIVGISGRIQDIYSTKLIFTILGGLTLIFVLPTGISLVKEYKYYLERKE